MKEIQYSTIEERSRIIIEQNTLGLTLMRDHHHINGGFLTFNDNLLQINAKKQYRQSLESDTFLQKLTAASFTDIDDWVDNNVMDIATARTLFKKMLMVISYLLNKE